MTGSERDFDRIARAWLDLGPNEAPDRSVAAVLQAIETTPQVRRSFRWPTWRSTAMARFALLATLGGALLIALGALAISGGGPTPAPSVAPASAAPTTLAPAATPTASPTTAPSSSPAAIPDALTGGWIAPMRGPDIPAADSIQALTLGATAGSFEAPSSYVSTGQGFVATLDGPGTLRLTTKAAEGPCEADDVGIYDYEVRDPAQLVMTLREDACSVRGERMAGLWHRSLAHGSAGGPGFTANFLPYLSFTLPAGTYTGRGDAGRDEIVIDSATSTYKVWKDLDGFLDPCDLSKGRLLIEPGLDALLAYFEDDPRFDIVRREEFEIDGRPAVEIEFTVGANLEPPCWTFDGVAGDLTGVLTYVPQGATPDTFWNAPIGSTGLLVITEVDGTTLTFEFLTFEDGTEAVDRATLDTVRFLDALPEAPAG